MEVNTEKVKSMTMQEAFDYIVNHMATQKGRCIGAFTCLYRSRDGAKACAIGCMVPDDVARTLDGLSLSAVSDDSAWGAAKEYLPPLDRSFFQRMQSCHDGQHDAAALRGRLEKVAFDFGLDGSSVAGITEWN